MGDLLVGLLFLGAGIIERLVVGEKRARFLSRAILKRGLSFIVTIVTESTEQTVEKGLRLALFIALQRLHEVEEWRKEFFGFGGGYAPAFLG